MWKLNEVMLRKHFIRNQHSIKILPFLFSCFERFGMQKENNMWQLLHPALII